MTEQDKLLVQALVDGELDARSAFDLEARFATEPDLALAHTRLTALRERLRDVPAARAPDELRRRVLALADEGAVSRRYTPARVDRVWTRWSLAAAIAASLLVGAIGGWLGTTAVRPTSEAEALAAAHVRGLIAGRPFDVASSDNHTVRPWFAGKVAVAPFVADLASDGFVLEGGRIDVVAGMAASTLVYRRGPHTISVTQLPAGRDAHSLLRPEHGAVEGLATLTWRNDDSNYLAVSDAAPGELDALRASFDNARQAGQR